MLCRTEKSLAPVGIPLSNKFSQKAKKNINKNTNPKSYTELDVYATRKSALTSVCISFVPLTYAATYRE
jgi:hypothetical protein